MKAPDLDRKIAWRRLKNERVNVSRAYKQMLRMLPVLGLGETGTRTALHALAMYAAAIIKNGCAGDPGLSRTLLSWMHDDIQKGVFVNDGKARKKKRA